MQIYVSWGHGNPPWAISPQAIVSRAIALGGGCPGMFVRGGLSRGICSTMARGIFGANSSFGVELCATGGVCVFFFFSASIGKAFIFAGGLGAGLPFYGMV